MQEYTSFGSRINRYSIEHELEGLSIARRRDFYDILIEKNLSRCMVMAGVFLVYEPISLILQLTKIQESTAIYLYTTGVLSVLSLIFILFYFSTRHKKNTVIKTAATYGYYLGMTLSISAMMIGDFTGDGIQQLYLNYIVLLSVLAVVPLLKWWVTLLYNCIPLAMLFYLSYQKFSGVPIEPIAMFLVAIMFGYIVSRSNIKGIISELRAMDARDILEKQLEKQLEHYRQLERAHMELRGYKHDILNHFISIATLIQDNDTKGALEYMDTISEAMKATNIVNYTNNQILDAILTSKAAVARQSGIDFRTDIRVPVDLAIEPIDLSIIMGNFLDNAIEACTRSEAAESYIAVTMGCQNEIVFGKIVNTSTSEAMVKNGALKTSKNDALNHGFGLSNAKRSIEKYNGFMTAQQQEGIFVTTFHMNTSMIRTI